MKKIGIFFAVIIIVLSGCFLPEYIDVEWITFTVRFDTDEGTYHRVVLADYYDLQNYRFLTTQEDDAGMSFISPDKNKVIILKRSGVIHNSDLWLYDLEEDTLFPLIDINDINFNGNILYGTSPIIWSRDSKGFYYLVGSSWGSSMRYYDFENEIIKNAPGLVQDVKGDDSLFVFAYDGHSGNYGISTIHREGGDLHWVDNPYLHRYTGDYGVIQNSRDMKWNEKTNEFLFSFYDTTMSGARIAITDQDGSRKTEYTSLFQDNDPIWGPNNEIVFFERIEGINSYLGSHVLDTKTKTVRKLSDMVDIDEATNLLWVSY